VETVNGSNDIATRIVNQCTHGSRQWIPRHK
jgi:hypothetical protein